MTTKTLGAQSVPVTSLAFDPVDWLARFKAVGGWWYIGADQKMWVGWRLDQLTNEEINNDQPFPARVVYREIEHDTAKREALKGRLLGEARHGNA